MWCMSMRRPSGTSPGGARAGAASQVLLLLLLLLLMPGDFVDRSLTHSLTCIAAASP